MKKIKFLTEDSIEMLKKNRERLYKEVILSGDKDLAQFMGEAGQIRETPFEIEEFTLEMGQPEGKESLTDGENAQRIYSHMKGLSDSQASDERIWMAYTLSENIDYMKYRWRKTCNSPEDMMNRYFFNYTKNRSLFRNGMARLWWIGRVTYDEKRKDPFELTKFLCSQQDIIESMCGRTAFNNSTVLSASLAAIYDVTKDCKGNQRDNIREIAKYVNLMAGTYIVDMFSYEEVYNKVCAKLNELIKR